MSSSAAAVLDEILDPVSRCFTPDAARKLLQLRADPTAQIRIEELAEKATEGGLSEEERDEYAAYVAAGTFVAILQAKARALLAVTDPR